MRVLLSLENLFQRFVTCLKDVARPQRATLYLPRALTRIIRFVETWFHSKFMAETIHEKAGCLTGSLFWTQRSHYIQAK